MSPQQWVECIRTRLSFGFILDEDITKEECIEKLHARMTKIGLLISKREVASIYDEDRRTDKRQIREHIGEWIV